ncbi:hypothetical protein [Lactobacillus sp. PV034]|uniref:hypothetical protein n=1 Tax=Lactobacillus sp. PV034 TaxID=2594495 RepID=UPI002240D5DD|nr:hypothetical protein [Lactobacillus sp. PV034]QNQ80395.1 hypothetical protein FP432_01915 [Lactobacillus sp. PV034]
MTSFKSILWEELKLKSKTIYSIFIIQLVAGLLVSFWTMTDHVFSPSFWQVDLFVTMTWSTVIGLISYFVISIYQNKNILLSKTWNLVPIETAKLLYTNFLSSIIGFFYFSFLQIVLLLILLLPINKISSTEWMIHLPFVGPYLASSSSWSNLTIDDYFKIIILVLIAVLFIYILFAFISISSHVLSSFVRIKYQKFAKFLTDFVLIIVSYYMFVQFFRGIGDILRINFIMKNNLTNSGIETTIFSILILDIVFLLLTTWEVNNLFETKAQN